MAMTNGCITPIASPSVAGKEAGDNALREIGKRKKWFTRSTQEPWAALLVSEQTRQFYAGSQVVDRFLAHALGVFRVGWEEHLPITLITDMDLNAERLKPYKVLILPNAAALSDDQVKTIRKYVNNGGGLVASCETSLFNELGQMRSNFALSDVFGVDYGGRPDVPVKTADVDINFARVIDEKYWAKRVGGAEIRWGRKRLSNRRACEHPAIERRFYGHPGQFQGANGQDQSTACANEARPCYVSGKPGVRSLNARSSHGRLR